MQKKRSIPSNDTLDHFGLTLEKSNEVYEHYKLYQRIMAYEMAKNKIVCECGKTTNKHDRKRHIRSAAHIRKTTAV
jgi:hypothetical protein